MGYAKIWCFFVETERVLNNLYFLCLAPEHMRCVFLVSFNIQDVCSIRFLFFVLTVGVGGPASIKLGSSDGFFRQEVSSVPWRCVGFWRKFYLSWAAAAGSLAKMGWVLSWLNMFMGGLGSTEWYNPGGVNVETAGMASECIWVCIWYNMSQCSAI